MKIALLGYGVEGESAYKYYSRTQPDAQFLIYDNAEQPKYDIPSGVEFVGSVADFYDIDADIVVKTPAISPDKVSSTGKITSVTREFFDKCPAPIIGVTGTKGKGTTCTLIYEILKAAGKKVFLVGNIGAPALDILADVTADSIVIYELSSFQLWDLEKSPHIAVILMIDSEHLDVHADLKDYIMAKSNIISHQLPNDMAIYYSDNDTSRLIGEATVAKKVPFNVPDDENVEVDGQKIINRSDIKLIGEHNLQNVYAAILATWHYTQDVGIISSVLRKYRGLPHRLEIVAEKKGVTFVNDSFSSAPSSTIAAIRSFTQPEILIAGGFDRGLQYDDLAKSIVDQKNIKKVLLIGQTKMKVANSLDKLQWDNYLIDETNDFKSIVQSAVQLASRGDVVLLSPGCPSFDMFKNFTERGEEFRKLVGEL